MRIKLGYIIASNQVMIDGKRIGYLYRERPDNESDSGWRVMSGDETEVYADDPANWALYNASTIVDMDPSIKAVLHLGYPVEFERDPESGGFIQLDPQDPDAND